MWRVERRDARGAGCLTPLRENSSPRHQGAAAKITFSDSRGRPFPDLSAAHFQCGSPPVSLSVFVAFVIFVYCGLIDAHPYPAHGERLATHRSDRVLHYLRTSLRQVSRAPTIGPRGLHPRPPVSLLSQVIYFSIEGTTACVVLSMNCAPPPSPRPVPSGPIV